MEDNDGHGITFVFKGLDYTTPTTVRTNVLMVKSYLQRRRLFGSLITASSLNLHSDELNTK